jgi:hypothetical protein
VRLSIKMGVVFLAYVNRSGSTFLSQQLSRSPDVCVCPEANVPLRKLVENLDPGLGLGPRGLERLNRALSEDSKLRTWGLTEDGVALSESMPRVDALHRLIDAYRASTKPEARWILCKGPFFLDAYRGLADALRERGVETRCLVLARDGRAVFASQKRSRSTNTGQPMQVDPVLAGRTWSRFILQALKAERQADVLLMRYEAVIQDPEGALARALRFLGVPAEEVDDVGDLWERIPGPQRSLHERVHRTADASRIEIWRDQLTPREVSLYEFVSHEALEACGYELLGGGMSRFRRLLSTLWYRVRWLINRIRGRARWFVRGRSG